METQWLNFLFSEQGQNVTLRKKSFTFGVSSDFLKSYVFQCTEFGVVTNISLQIQFPLQFRFPNSYFTNIHTQPLCFLAWKQLPLSSSSRLSETADSDATELDIQLVSAAASAIIYFLTVAGGAKDRQLWNVWGTADGVTVCVALKGEKIGAFVNDTLGKTRRDKSLFKTCSF